MQSFLLKLAVWRVSPSMATALTSYILQGFILYTELLSIAFHKPFGGLLFVF